MLIFMLAGVLMAVMIVPLALQFALYVSAIAGVFAAEHKRGSQDSGQGQFGMARQDVEGIASPSGPPTFFWAKVTPLPWKILKCWDTRPFNP